VRRRAWPLRRTTAPGIGAWNYGTATARLRAWCLRRTEPDSGACSVDAALVCLVCLHAWCQQLTAPTLVRGVTTQHWCAFALSVYDLPHLTLVRRVTALRYGTTSRLVPDSGAWASAPLQSPITVRDFLQHLAVVLQVPHLKVVCRLAHLTVVRGVST
jgi:hypothetical protein